MQGLPLYQDRDKDKSGTLSEHPPTSPGVPRVHTRGGVLSRMELQVGGNLRKALIKRLPYLSKGTGKGLANAF